MSTLTPLSGYLTDFCASRGLTLENCHERTGIAVETWKRWELGKNSPEIGMWLKIANATGFLNFDAFWQEYCQFCLNRPRRRSRYQASDIGELQPSVYDVLHRSLRDPNQANEIIKLLDFDLSRITDQVTFVQMSRKQAEFLIRAGTLMLEASDWRRDCARAVSRGKNRRQSG
jgi:transcriptional regulator with XRE-family HTH domain